MEKKPRIFTTSFASVYPLYVQKAERKGRTKEEVDAIITWLTGYTAKKLEQAIERKVDQGGKRETFERLHRWAARAPYPIRRLLFRPVLKSFGGRLHTIGVGGSALDPELGQRWSEMGINVLQGYGATELGPLVSFTRKENNRLNLALLGGLTTLDMAAALALLGLRPTFFGAVLVLLAGLGGFLYNFVICDKIDEMRK